VAAKSSKKSTPTQSSSITPLLIDRHAAAKFVGVPHGTIRRWDEEGILPSVHAGRGGRRMYSPRDLERAVERMKVVAE
jgi:hypothetical protein